MGNLFHLDSHIIFFAFFLDLLIGDPPRIPHPISGMGFLIQKLENPIRGLPFFSERVKGLFFFLVVVIVIFTIALCLTQVLFILREKSLLGEVILIFVTSQFLALRGLIDAGKVIENYLERGLIIEAREALKALVGRDREHLSKSEIQRAILESYSENLNDALIAPLFWVLLLGLPGLILYKTVNTLDSMVGYKNERYLHFGFFSAKGDDLFNYIPARLTALLIILATALILGIKTALRSLYWTIKYGPLHSSPNAGYPEAALAGALGVRLLGPTYYGGKLHLKPYLGKDLLSNLHNTIPMSRKLLYLASFLGLALLLLINTYKA